MYICSRIQKFIVSEKCTGQSATVKHEKLTGYLENETVLAIPGSPANDDIVLLQELSRTLDKKLQEHRSLLSLVISHFAQCHA